MEGSITKVLFTTEELADRWEDRRAIENLMARRCYYQIFRQSMREYNELWCRKTPDPALGVNEGWYKGYDAVEGYYSALERLTELKTSVAMEAYPDKLGNISPEKARGAGSLPVYALTTPVIEIALDRNTAKGIWMVDGADTDLSPSGPKNEWVKGRIGVDFVREDGEWKIWRLAYAEEVRTEVGSSWASPAPELEPVKPFDRLASFEMPKPNVPEKLFERYHFLRPMPKFPEVPEPVAEGGRELLPGEDPELFRKIDRVWDVQDIKNLMGRHAYCFSYGMQEREMEELWVQKPENRKTASFAQSCGYQCGYDVVYENMVTRRYRRVKAALAAFREVHPEIEDKPENYGIGEMVMHQLTTPVIEIAEDGLTAQGAWYTPGNATFSEPDGTVEAYWMYERYGMDFIKEDGVWKIWHLFVGTDLEIPVGASAKERPVDEEPTTYWDEGDDGMNLRLTHTFQAYSSRYNWSEYPPIPKPYRTFSETTSNYIDGNPLFNKEAEK